jgi:hypothetical protein
VAHLTVIPILTTDDAAGRLREQLPRGARVDGDLWLLPFRRVAAHGPVGATWLDILAAGIGEPRLHSIRMPDADLHPFEGNDGPAGGVFVPATADENAIRERAEAVKCTVDRLDRLVHYPFWRLRIDDVGRVTTAWVDAVEGSVIVHNLDDRGVVLPLSRAALLLALPAALMGFAELEMGEISALTVAMAAAALAATVLNGTLRGRLERRD